MGNRQRVIDEVDEPYVKLVELAPYSRRVIVPRESWMKGCPMLEPRALRTIRDLESADLPHESFHETPLDRFAKFRDLDQNLPGLLMDGKPAPLTSVCWICRADVPYKIVAHCSSDFGVLIERDCKCTYVDWEKKLNDRNR